MSQLFTLYTADCRKKFRSFKLQQHLHLHHCVCLPRHSLAKISRTSQDLPLKFSGLSRTKSIFQDFPGPGNFIFKIQDFPGGVGTLYQTVIRALAIMADGHSNIHTGIWLHPLSWHHNVKFQYHGTDQSVDIRYCYHNSVCASICLSVTLVIHA